MPPKRGRGSGVSKVRGLNGRFHRSYRGFPSRLDANIFVGVPLSTVTPTDQDTHRHDSRPSTSVVGVGTPPDPRSKRRDWYRVWSHLGTSTESVWIVEGTVGPVWSSRPRNTTSRGMRVTDSTRTPNSLQTTGPETPLSEISNPEWFTLRH